MADVTLVLHYRRTATAGLNVLLGAIEQELREPDWLEIVAVHRPDELDAAVTAAATAQVVVAWSFYSPEVLDVAAELAAARRAAPWVIHLAGGVHATAEPEATLDLGFDLVVAGEGEEPIVRLLGALAAGQPLDEVPGLIRRSRDGIVRNAPAPRHPLDRFPPFAPRHGRFNAIEITRGCVYGCTFCQTPFMFKARFRHRPVDDIVHWVQVMRATGRRDVRFLTPTSLSYGSTGEQVELDAVEELLSAVHRAAGAGGRVFFGTFPSEVRPEHVTPAALAVIKRFCANDNLVIGGQSGSEAMLARTNRGHGVEVVIDAVRIALGAGFTPNVDFLFGLPGETPDDVAATRSLAERLVGLGARVHSHAFMPLPGTPLRDAPPGRIDAETATALDRLASQGGAYGAWRRQTRVAEALVEVRPTRRRRPADHNVDSHGAAGDPQGRFGS